MIFMALTNNLGEAVQKLQNGKRNSAHVTCPKYGTKNANGKGDGFRLDANANETGKAYSKDGTLSNGFATVMWANDWDFRQTINEIGDFLMLPESSQIGKDYEPPAPVIIPLSEEDIADIKMQRDKNLALWNESIPITRAPQLVKTYLGNRSIMLRQNAFDGALRFHPSVPYYTESDTEKDDKGYAKIVCLGKYPALVAKLASGNDEYFNTHKTYLTPLGEKADVPKAKKIGYAGKRASIPLDAFIRLGGFPRDGILGLSEGIENALSGMAVYNIPVWATYSSSLLKSRDIPKGIHTVIIFADKDRPDLRGRCAGEVAAEQLKEKLEKMGITCITLYPEDEIPEGEKSLDWNIVLRTKGRSGFPSLAHLWKRNAS